MESHPYISITGAKLNKEFYLKQVLNKIKKLFCSYAKKTYSKHPRRKQNGSTCLILSFILVFLFSSNIPVVHVIKVCSMHFLPV